MRLPLEPINETLVTEAKAIASRFPKELGFVNSAALKKSQSRNELEVIEGVGFAHFHHRKDAQTTIYEIAVSKENQGQGWGRLLFYRVLCAAIEKKSSSVFLKCPVDNKSNGFYKALGFKLERIDPGKKRPLNCWRYPIELPLLFYCGGGGGSPADLVAKKTGWRVGMRSGRYKAKWHLEMVDNLFTSYNHEKHLAQVKASKPLLCTAMDLMTEEQCLEVGAKYQPAKVILGQAKELSKYCGRVLLIPKYKLPLPRDFPYWLAYSVPTSHGGTDIETSWFVKHNKPVHLLGGSPDKQRHYYNQRMNVVSLDANYASKLAQRFGKSCWQGNSSGKRLVDGFYNALQLSLEKQHEYWRNDARKYKQLSFTL